MNHYRTGWISDIHLGTRGAQADALLAFLKANEFETLYVVGDLIDVWSLKRGIYWPQSHNDVIQKLLRAGRKGTRIIYIPGNHDEFLANYHGEYGSMTVQERAIHTTADGTRLLVIHGHELDTVVQNARWLALIGDVGYQFLLWLNRPLNFLRRLFGLGYWSLSSYAKQKVKGAVNYVGKFEEAIAERNQYECNACRYQFSATSGTIFHDSHLPLSKWFLAIYIMTESKKGVSAKQMQRTLATTYRTAWHLCHRIRSAVRDANAELLRGIVEIDETYVGGKVKGRGRGYKGNKAMAIGAVQRGGKLRLQVIQHANKETLHKFVAENTAPDTEAI